MPKLTALSVQRAKRPGYYGDGDGLYLQVTPGNKESKKPTKSWIFRYRFAGHLSRNGKPLSREMGLGSASTFTLAEARDRAREQRQLLALGRDPIMVRDVEKADAKAARAKLITFKEAAQKYIAAHSPGWSNRKHRNQWTKTLETYAYPVAGTLPVSEIDTTIMLKIIEPIWYTKTETASRVRGRIESVLDWATVRGFRKGDNPARWRGHLDTLLPAKADVRHTEHYPALPYAEAPAFMADLRAYKSTSARALQLTILCALRTNEVLEARWPEVNEAEKVWIIPAERMKGKRKNKREHRVPLSDAALEILKSLPRGGDFIFPGAKKGRPLSNMALLEVMRGMNARNEKLGRPRWVDPEQLDKEGKPKDAVPHGFRSTFRDWAADRTSFPNHVCEAALAHTIDSKVEAAYRRGDLFEKRRRLMDAWGKFAMGGVCMAHSPGDTYISTTGTEAAQ